MTSSSNQEELLSLLSQLNSSDIKSAIKEVSPSLLRGPQRGPLQWVTTSHIIECLNCNRIYSGVIHYIEGYDPPNRIGWCPRCIESKEAVWWDHCLHFKISEVR